MCNHSLLLIPILIIRYQVGWKINSQVLLTCIPSLYDTLFNSNIHTHTHICTRIHAYRYIYI